MGGRTLQPLERVQRFRGSEPRTRSRFVVAEAMGHAGRPGRIPSRAIRNRDQSGAFRAIAGRSFHGWPGHRTAFPGASGRSCAAGRSTLPVAVLLVECISGTDERSEIGNVDLGRIAVRSDFQAERARRSPVSSSSIDTTTPAFESPGIGGEKGQFGPNWVVPDLATESRSIPAAIEKGIGGGGNRPQGCQHVVGNFVSE